MKVIDIHTHVLPQYVPLAVEQMNRCNIECAGLLCWHDGFGSGLQKYVEALAPYPGRFLLFGNIDWRRINEPDFGKNAAKQIERDAGNISGIKIFKSLGLEYRKDNGDLWHINDPEFDPIWKIVGRLQLPVLIHTADPSYFWEPLNGANFWNGVLHSEYAWWSYYRKNMPSPEELLAERDEVIAKFPDTIFIAPHLGSRSNDLDRAAEGLEDYPNLFYDISARIPIMGKSQRRARHAREFLLEFQDRILFGTDMIYDDTNLPTGMQSQCLFQPYEVPLPEGKSAEDQYLETSSNFFNYNLEFLTTESIISKPPVNRTSSPLTTFGVDLPTKTLEKICNSNVRKLFKELQ